MDDFDFSTSLETQFDLSEEELNELVEKLGVDDLTNLIDAVQRRDKQAALHVLHHAKKMDRVHEGKKIDKRTRVEKAISSAGKAVSDAAKNRRAGPQDKASKRDKLDKIKKKEERDDVGESFNIGDKVKYMGKTVCRVKIPNGPCGLVGINLDGDTQMVEKTDLERVDESILGISMLQGIQRMRELAGLRGGIAEDMNSIMGDHQPPPLGALPPPHELDDDLADLAPEDDMDDLGGDDLGGDEPPLGDIPGQPPSIDAKPSLGGPPPLGGPKPPMGDMPPLGGPKPPMGDLGGPPLGGPPSLGGPPPSLGGPPSPALAGPGMTPPPVNPAMAVTAVPPVVNSAAYTAIEDALNNIQRQLAEIKLSEYKMLVKRLEDLSGQARKMGKDFLGEKRSEMSARVDAMIAKNDRSGMKPRAEKFIAARSAKKASDKAFARDTHGAPKVMPEAAKPVAEAKSFKDYLLESKKKKKK